MKDKDLKKIFITIFEGVESKNILRTDIIKTLMAKRNLSIVFFVKNELRLEYHRKEFGHDPRIEYEVVAQPRVRGLNWLFMHFKFTLLKTGTTKFMRRLSYLKRGNLLFYYFGFAANIIFARPFFIKLSRKLDFLLVRNRRYGKYFDKHKPDAVFLANPFDESEVDLVREAKRRNVKTVALINSWDRATARSVLRLVPDKLIVFNDYIKKSLTEKHAIDESKIIVGGIAHYDYHFNAPYCDRETFCRKIGLDPNLPIIVYAPLGNEYSDADWEILDLLGQMNERNEFGRRVNILVRVPPNDYVNEEEMKKRPMFVYDYPGTRFSPKKGLDWDMTYDELRHLSDTLYHMSILVCYATSLSVEGAVFDKPVINVDFEIRKDIPVYRSPTHFYKKEHYKRAIDSGGIRMVKSESELGKWIKQYLENPSIDRNERKRLVKEMCHFTDGKSGERVGRIVLEEIYT